ncbi:phosphatase PAP2 family protein [Mycobacterium sp. ITM-2016-00317]|uniref:phosphatase PAP2 family protein n=1 Tax=Mycobacterium sp. ITM-2016-00317 TaxID=2099694 RepID=UPI000D4B302F|nr:phosphatase PAP2 family protein [Mycobacterium sp. ITM-2016-00317]WNG88130.1 phosphatase PAP2 family protein [Mycobacterium sp. ITM-2016-00317]
MRLRTGWLVGSAVAAFAVYLLMWLGYVQGWPWLVGIDTAALDAAYRFAATRPGWVTGWDVFCTVLGPGAFRLAVLVVIVIALTRRRYRLAVFLLLTVELSGPLTEAAKHIADRPRPDTAMVSAMSSAFPSGHALGVMVSVAALLTVALPVVRPRWRTALIALGVLLILTIGAGRVVLNVHHPSDVVAGWGLGYAYFVGCLLLVKPVRAAAGTREELDTAR